MAKKLMLWVCRMVALLTVCDVLGMALVSDGHGGTLLRTCVWFGGFVLCAMAAGLFALTFIPAVLTGKKAGKPAQPVAPPVNAMPYCQVCVSVRAAHACDTHRKVLCDNCRVNHLAIGCQVRMLDEATFRANLGSVFGGQ